MVAVVISDRPHLSAAQDTERSVRDELSKVVAWLVTTARYLSVSSHSLGTSVRNSGKWLAVWLESGTSLGLGTS